MAEPIKIKEDSGRICTVGIIDEIIVIAPQFDRLDFTVVHQVNGWRVATDF